MCACCVAASQPDSEAQALQDVSVEHSVPSFFGSLSFSISHYPIHVISSVRDPAVLAFLQKHYSLINR
jgi:hypothetical protein